MIGYSHATPLLEKHITQMLGRLGIHYTEKSLSEYCEHLYSSTDWKFVISGKGTPQGVAGFRQLKWDSNIYGVKIGSIGVASLSSDIREDQKQKVCESLIRKTVKAVRDEGYEMLVCRIPLADLAWIQALEDAGFVTTDVQCPLICRDLQKVPMIKNPAFKTVIREARVEDMTEIISFGKSAFGRSHLYADSKLPVRLSDKLHEEWLRNNIVNGRAAFTLVAEADGKIAGFVSALWDDAQQHIFGIGHGHIDLIAVQENFQKQGIGSLLLSKAMERLAESDARIVTVSTQATNLNAIKLYQQSGYDLSGFEVTLHG
jgi:dTDP-4-amino-4,6-dideoxy-D-galactose acyltransferase